MNRNISRMRRAALAGIVLLFPALASAHEVYVLDRATIARDIAVISPNPFTAYRGSEADFFFWGFVSVVTVLTVFFASVFRTLERAFDPFFFYIKRFAHPLVRLTFGVCLIAIGLKGGLFGPELPLTALFGAAAPFMATLFLLLGLLGLAGFYTRAAAGIMIAVFVYAVTVDGSYLFTYANYFGEFALLFILGSGHWSLDDYFRTGRLPALLRRFAHRLEHLAFPLMRILFGFSVMYASVYAKFVHSRLALDVVTAYHLTTYFPFPPLFVVMGALIIEFLAGAMMMLGIEIRWTGLFLLFWLTLSLLYFGEAVWPHLVLFGLGLAIFCHGYDRYSLEGLLFKRHRLEPVL